MTTYCSRCGAEVPGSARFCPGCGEAVAPAVPAPVAPAPAPAAGPAAGLPAWATSDWLVAVVSAGLLLGVCLVVALPYGALLAVAATGDAGSIISGLITGVFLPFVMFGVETAAARFDGDTLVVLGQRSLPLLLLAVPVAATWIALRFALPRVRPAPGALVALVVKIALVVCIAAAVMAGLLSIGEDTDFGDEGFVAEVSAGAAAIYPFLLIVPAGLAFLWRRGIRPWAGPVDRARANPWVRSALWGGAAFVGLAAVMGVLALLADVITADDGKGRVFQIVRAPLDQLNEGVAGAVVAMGGAVARLGSHTSLLHWRSYEAPGDGNAPAPLFLLLALAPAAVAWLTWRRLDRERPAVEQQVLQISTAVAAGFVVTAWLLSLLGRIERIAVDPVVQPSPRGAFGLGLVWAALGAAGAALYWSKRHGFRGSLLPAVGAPAPSPPSPPSPPTPPPPPPRRRRPPPVPPVDDSSETVELTQALPPDPEAPPPR